ncbi:MAG: hypothetical protein AAF688_01540 [Bacteroidota bacterium]
MKLNLFSCVFILTSFFLFGQNEQTEKISKSINTDLSAANKNFEKGINSFDLKSCLDNAKKAYEFVVPAYNALQKDNCQKAADLIYEMKSEIEAAMRMDEHEHAKMYLAKAQKLIPEAFYEHEVCMANGTGDLAIAELNQKQRLLEQQQKELEMQRSKIKDQLAKQQLAEQKLIKKRFITKNTEALEKTVQALNKSLEACDCNKPIEKDSKNFKALNTKSLDEIKLYFLEITKQTTKTYMATLDECDD